MLSIKINLLSLPDKTKKRLEGSFGETNPQIFDISYIGKINLKLKFKHIAGMPKKRNTEATELVMKAVEIRESYHKFLKPM